MYKSMCLIVTAICLSWSTVVHAECLYTSSTVLEGYDSQQKITVTSSTKLLDKQSAICTNGNYIAATQSASQAVLDIQNKATKTNPKVLAGDFSCQIINNNMFLPSGSLRVYKAAIGSGTQVSWLDIPNCGCSTLMQTQYGMIANGSSTELFVITDFDQKQYKKVVGPGNTATHAGKYVYSIDTSSIHRFEIDTTNWVIINKKTVATTELIVDMTADLASNRLMAVGRRSAYLYDLDLKLLQTIPLSRGTKPTFSSSNFLNGSRVIAVASQTDVYFYDLSGTQVKKWTSSANVYAVHFAQCPASPTCTTGQTQPCTTGSNVGECKKGTQTCSNGVWGSCVGAVSPSQEVCDGKDNNCDGSIDNGIADKTCSTSCGTGTERCVGGSWSCDAPKTCDCKAGETQSCVAGQGECAQGTQTCDQNNKWGQCVPDNQPTKEICGDGKDNDCNGQIDDGCPAKCTAGTTRPCNPTNSLGECKNTAIETCQSDGSWSQCVPGQPSAETCDGKDNDCNGMIDEGGVCECTPGQTQACDHEVCGQGKGVQECDQDGKWIAKCEAPPIPTSAYNPVTVVSGQADLTYCGPGIYILKGPTVQPLTVPDSQAQYAKIRVQPSKLTPKAYEFGLQGWAVVNSGRAYPGRTHKDGVRIIRLNSQAAGFQKVTGIKIDLRCPTGHCIAGLEGTEIGFYRDAASYWKFVWFTHKDLAILDLEGTDSQGNPVSVQGVRVTGTPVPGAVYNKLEVNTRQLDGLSKPITREQPPPPDENSSVEESPKPDGGSAEPAPDAGPSDQKPTTDEGTPPNIGCSGCSFAPDQKQSPLYFFLGLLLLLILRGAWGLKKHFSHLS